MINLLDYGFNSNETGGEGEIPARVSAVHKERYEIICQYGITNARLKSSIYFGKGDENFPTTGDFIFIKYNDCGDSLITKTLERKSFFARRDPAPGRGEQAVAANFDWVFIMASLNHDFNIKRIERYLTLAWQSGATPVVVLTKADLIEDFSKEVQAVEKIATGVSVYAVSAKSGLGMDGLSPYLKPHTTIVLLGSSGIGKSSLVNALSDEEIMKVNDIRKEDSRGRHTTTHRQLIMTAGGVMIIDTPGMRELGMWDVSQGLGSAFSDVEDLFGLCKFSNCTHNNEPGCAINAAIENGSLSASRWQNYLKLKQEAKYSDDKAGYIRERVQWAKSIAKQKKSQKF